MRNQAGQSFYLSLASRGSLFMSQRGFSDNYDHILLPKEQDEKFEEQAILDIDEDAHKYKNLGYFKSLKILFSKKVTVIPFLLLSTILNIQF